jgi:SIR2-like domain
MRCGQIDFPEDLLHAIRDGRFVVFAGAGVSMGDPANLPSFWRLAEQVAAGSGLAPGDDEPLDRFLGQLHNKGKGIAVHQRAADILSRPEPTATPLHSDLLRLFPSPEQIRIVTTNFDLLFQRAAKDIWGSVPEVFRTPALPLGRNFHGIVHVHGALTAHQDIVLTDSDFGRAYLTEGWARRFLVDLFRHFTVLFVGYSHSDTVMHYLARALPEQEVGHRYALDSTEGDPQFWRLLGIEPILFQKSHKSNYSKLYDGIHLSIRLIRSQLPEFQAARRASPPSPAVVG